MHNIGAKVVEIKGEDLRKIKQEILTFPKIHSVAQQGVRLRVLVDNEITQPIEYLQHKITTKNMTLNITRPSLEDVFVVVTGDKNK